MKRLSLLVVAALALGACGGPQRTFPSGAGGTTLAQGSAKAFTKQIMRFDESSAGGGGTVVMTSDGVIDFARQLQHATMTATGDGPQGELIAQQVGRMEIIGEGFVVYLKSDLYQQMIPGAREWVKMDLQAIGEEIGLDLGSLTQMNQSDAGASLEYLKGLEDVEYVGPERVRGVETAHWAGIATFENLSEVLSEDAAPTIDRLQEIMGIDEFDVEVWIDGNEIVRRLKFDYAALPNPGAEGSWTMMMEFYDFGTEVDVVIPPPEQVTDLLEIIRQQQGT